MQIEYANVKGKKFEQLNVGAVFEFQGNTFMKIDTVYNEVHSVKKSYNCINLVTGKLDVIKYDNIVKIVDAKIVLY